MSSPVSSSKMRVAADLDVASASMAAVKFVVGIAIGSLALISEALHSSVDLVATVVTWIVVRISDRPADDEHHYGHGKIESLSALGVIALLYVLAGGIVVQAYSHLREGLRSAHALGDSIRRAADRHRRQFLARPRAAPGRASNPESGACGRCPSFRLRRPRIHRCHHRTDAVGIGLCVGRCRRRNRRGGPDLHPGPAARTRHDRNLAGSRAGRRSGKSPCRDQGAAGRCRYRASAGAHGRPPALCRCHGGSSANLSDRSHRRHQAAGTGSRVGKLSAMRI